MKDLRSVLIFGVDVKTPKDEVGSSAMLESGPCIQAIKLLKSHLPQLLIARDLNPISTKIKEQIPRK